MSEELSPLERTEEPGAHMSENLEIMQRSSKGELLIQSALPTVRQQGAPHPAFASERADGEIAKLVLRLFV
jgi:hypothetical protein